jgi:hypothetical protein
MLSVRTNRTLKNYVIVCFLSHVSHHAQQAVHSEGSSLQLWSGSEAQLPESFENRRIRALRAKAKFLVALVIHA